MQAQAIVSDIAPTAGVDKTSIDQSPEAARLITRFEHIPFSPWHRRSRILMGSATFLDAFDALSLAFAMPILVKLWQLSPVDVGWLIGASYVGQLVGALFFSRFAESRGRIPSAAIATAIMSVMGIVCVFAGSLPWLFACRLVQGIGVGGEMPVAAAYISELSRARGRAAFSSSTNCCFRLAL